MKRVIKYSYNVVLYTVAAIGLAFIAVFVGLKLNLTNVPGTVDLRSEEFATLSQTTQVTAVDDLEQTDATSFSIEQIDQKITEAQSYINQLTTVRERAFTVLCTVQQLSGAAGANAKQLWATYKSEHNQALFEKQVFALEPYTTTTFPNCETNQTSLTDTTVDAALASATDTNVYPWVNSPEWPVLKTAIIKDQDIIKQAADEANIPARLIVSALVVEQLRLYHTQREYYEQYFEPLKILANASQFAWGVMSIKEAAAKEIERNLTDSTSDYYLGEEYAHRLDFSTPDVAGERFRRLSNEQDHYYSYLYGGLYLKQFITQWGKAGYDIHHRPEIITTLFNIGFSHSQPKANPAVGGSSLEIGGHQYTFGGLGFEFYYSGELQEQFPY